MKSHVKVCKQCKHSFKIYDNKDQYECRRYPPQVNPNFNAAGAFPQVNYYDWCGEFVMNQKMEMI